MDDELPPKQPLKKRRSRVPKETKPIPTPTPEPSSAVKITSLSALENEIFLRQINSFLNKKDIAERPIRQNISDYKVLQTTIGEFLESFVIFGYTFEGERLLIQDWPTPKDRDALLEFLKNVFVMNTSSDEIDDHE